MPNYESIGSVIDNVISHDFTKPEKQKAKQGFSWKALILNEKSESEVVSFTTLSLNEEKARYFIYDVFGEVEIQSVNYMGPAAIQVEDDNLLPVLDFKQFANLEDYQGIDRVVDYPIEDFTGTEIKSGDTYFLVKGEIVLESNIEDFLIERFCAKSYQAIEGR